jgi:hypothetical protein
VSLKTLVSAYPYFSAFDSTANRFFLFVKRCNGTSFRYSNDTFGGSVHIPAGDSLAVQVTSAIQNGDVEKLKELLNEHPGLATARIVDAKGAARTLLHIAADWPAPMSTHR